VSQKSLRAAAVASGEEHCEPFRGSSAGQLDGTRNRSLRDEAVRGKFWSPEISKTKFWAKKTDKITPKTSWLSAYLTLEAISKPCTRG
jgi:hypothetical protein